MSFNGLGMNLGNLSRISNAKTRSICAENFTGEKGKAGMAVHGTGENCARELGQGWKVSPSVRIAAHETFTMADIECRNPRRCLSRSSRTLLLMMQQIWRLFRPRSSLLSHST